MSIALRIGVMTLGLFVGQAQSQPPVPMPIPKPLSSAYDERLNALDREAIEAAYRNQIAFLFQVWMKDSTGQPQRALIGARQARRAFIGAMNELDKRGRP